MRVKVHRNLHSIRSSNVLPWVVKDSTSKRGCDVVVMSDVIMHHPGHTVGARRCRGELPPYVNPTGKVRKPERAVFAWFIGNEITGIHPTTTPPPEAIRCHLNPFTDTYFNVRDSERIDSARTAYLLEDGSAWIVE